MSHLIFGESLSPSEIRRVQLTTCDWLNCAQPGRHGGQPPGVCAACRYREPCGIRSDDKAAQERAMDAGGKVVVELCASGERRCIDHPYCGCVRRAVK